MIASKERIGTSALAFRRYVAAVPLSYIALTIGIFAPLFAAFAANRQFYPVPVWSLFSEAVQGEGREYYLLRGETVGNATIDIPAINLTDGLTGRNHMMVAYVMSNTSLTLKSPHPNNVRLLMQRESTDPSTDPLRVNDLLKAWGAIYNECCRDDSERLIEVRLDGYEWPGKGYSDYVGERESWRVEL